MFLRTLFLFLLSLSVLAETFIGKLHKEEGQYFLTTKQQEVLEINISKKYQKELKSLTKDFFETRELSEQNKVLEFFLAFEGERDGNKVIVSSSPQILSGNEVKHGTLTKRDSSYYLNEQEVVFDKSLVVNFSSFDEDSMQFFLNKNVSIIGKESAGSFLVRAIIPTDLYSAKEAQEEKVDYFLGPIYQDSVSQSDKSFRRTLYKKEDILPGEKGLIITLSGRQGDDPSALAGHFAAGSVTVKDDYSLDSEIWNFYSVPNEKKIIAGHNNFIDYFGNIIAGQNNYRPTYSLILYGVDKKVLRKIKDELGPQYAMLREGRAAFGVRHNCTTTGIKALKNAGIKAKRKRHIGSRALLGLGAGVVYTGGFLYAGAMSLFGKGADALDTKKSIQFALWKDPSRYIPLSSFNGYLKRLDKIISKFNVKRVDYIFQAQTASKRYTGGAPSENLMAIQKGSGMYDEMINPENPWSAEKAYEEVQKLME